MKILPRRPYRGAWWVAVIASVVAVGLAIIPHLSGSYDPVLAILTLTFIAIVWYTYFTFRAVNRYDATFLRTSLDGMLHPRLIELHPTVENRTVNTVWVRTNLEVWIDDESWEQDMFYSGRSDLELEPYGGFVGSQRIDCKTQPDSAYDPMTGESASPDYTEVRARLTIFWKDNLGETGRVGPRYYYARLQDAPALGPVIASERIIKLFGSLPQPSLEPPGGWNQIGARSSSSVSGDFKLHRFGGQNCTLDPRGRGLPAGEGCVRQWRG